MQAEIKEHLWKKEENKRRAFLLVSNSCVCVCVCVRVCVCRAYIQGVLGVHHTPSARERNA